MSYSDAAKKLMASAYTQAQWVDAVICEYENLLHDGFGTEDAEGEILEDGVKYLSAEQVEKRLVDMDVEQLMDFAGIQEDEVDDYMDAWLCNA